MDTVASSMRSGSFIIGIDGNQEVGRGWGVFPMFVKYTDKTGEIAMKRTANPKRSVCSTGENIFR